MALKSSYTAEEKGAEIEETLDALDTLIDRVKVLYEQYFMGIQRQPPTHLHTTLERELRELQQQQIRNTALRYRLATLQQKHGAYNTYWKRTLREIESGRYLRNLSKLRAKAARTGEEIPEEILAKMPKRMREAIAKDRELALAKAEREHQLPEEVKVAVAIEQSTEERKRLRRESTPAVVVSALPILDDPHAAHAHGHSSGSLHVPGATLPVSSQALPAAAKPSRGERHLLDDMFGDADIDQALAALADEAAVEIERRRPTTPPPLGKPADGPVRPGPAVKILPPGLTIRAATPPAGVPLRAATPPAGVPIRAATPPAGVPIRAATPPAGVPVLPPIPPSIGSQAGIHPLPPISGVQPAVTVAAAQAAADEVAPPPVEPIAPPPIAPPVAPTASSPSRAWPQPSSGVRPAVSKPTLSRPAATPPEAPPPGIPGMSEADTRALYAKYVKARTLVGDRTEPMTYERMVKTLSSQAPKILRDHHSTGVEFNVVVRDNKVILKAKPK